LKPSIAYPDYEQGNNFNIHSAPAEWSDSDQQYPTSLLYDTIGAKPSWWCDESGEFPNIGAHYDNNNGGNPVKGIDISYLPAERRRLGLPCTIDGTPTGP
jgi:hypothetical protein